MNEDAAMRPLLTCAIVASLALAPAAASANGRFPAANQLIVDPSDPQHIVTRATFGLMVTHDAGGRWDWVCEQAVGFGDYEDPSLALTKDGTTLGGTLKGLARGSPDACTWTFADAIGSAPVADVSAERADPTNAFALTSITTDGTVFATRVWLSKDDGKTWTRAGVDLPTDYLAFTLDAAPSDPTRIYVTGRHGAPAYSGSLSRSADGGATWTDLPIAGTDDVNRPFLGAIDPNDRDTLYVRVDSDPSDRLLVSHDGGTTWSTAFQAQGDLLGFAVSPDGATVAIGGTKDGIWTAPSTTLAFHKVSAVRVKCLTWAAAGLYACADEVDGFELGLSHDGGATFTPIMHLQHLCGPVSCPSGSPVATTCSDWWGVVSSTIQATPCDAADAGAPASSGSGSTSGCGCRIGARQNQSVLVATCALLALGAFVHRRRPR